MIARQIKTSGEVEDLTRLFPQSGFNSTFLNEIIKFVVSTQFLISII